MLTSLVLAAAIATPQSKAVEVGSVVPDVAVTDMSGKSVRISDFRGKKLIVFNWASW
jgi:cytochrome oxidase Cu insertion factor (SCO1/SenC/PrrC family)